MGNFLKKLNNRERNLLCLFLWAGAFILVFLGVKQLRATLKETGSAKAELKSIEEQIAFTPQVEERLKVCLEKLDPDKCFDASTFPAMIDSITSEVGLDKNIEPVKTTSEELLKTHSLRLVLSKAPISRLVAFDERIQKLSPYIRITELSIQSNKSNPEQLDTRITLSAIELKKDLKQ